MSYDKNHTEDDCDKCLRRVANMCLIKYFRRMVTIEPILDFDLVPLVAFVKAINPEWVNIGADSKGHGLPEPSGNKVKNLILELRKFTEVRLKDNLKRLVGIGEKK